MFARLTTLGCSVLLIVSATTAADSDYKVQALDQKPPDAVSSGVRAVLQSSGLRVLRPGGEALCDVWWVKTAELKPNFNPTSTVKYPFVPGGLVGVVRIPESGGHDFREQTIPAGTYSLRYALQPADGNHLGTSPYQDFLAMVPADVDTQAAVMSTLELEQSAKESTEALTHPGILSLQPPGSRPAESPAVRKSGDYWILSTSLDGKAGDKPMRIGLELVVVGHFVE